MRNIIYLSLTAIALTACSAATQGPQHNTNFGNQAQFGYQTQAAYSQAQTQYNAAQYNTAQYNYNNVQTPQFGQINPYTQATHNRVAQQAPTPVYNNQTRQRPALRGAHKVGKFTPYIYGTLGGVNYDTNIDNYGIEGRLGYQATKYFGAEIEGSIALTDDNDTFFDPEFGEVSSDTGFNNNAAIFAVGRIPVTNRIAIHGRAGYDLRSIDIDLMDELGNEANLEENLDGFAYGFGGEYALTQRNRLRVDYTAYESELGTADSISVSYKRKF